MVLHVNAQSFGSCFVAVAEDSDNSTTTTPQEGSTVHCTDVPRVGQNAFSSLTLFNTHKERGIPSLDTAEPRMGWMWCLFFSSEGCLLSQCGLCISCLLDALNFNALGGLLVASAINPPKALKFIMDRFINQCLTCHHIYIHMRL